MRVVVGDGSPVKFDVAVRDGAGGTSPAVSVELDAMPGGPILPSRLWGQQVTVPAAELGGVDLAAVREITLTPRSATGTVWIIDVSTGAIRHAVCTVSAERQYVAQLINRLAGAAGLDTRWSQQASSLASDREESVLTENMKLAVLLAGLTDRYGLVWSVEDKTLLIRSRDETDEAKLTNHRVHMAHNVLKYAVLEAPDHRWSNRANIELGNLALRQGKPDVAAEHYRLADDRTSSPVNVVASYGLAAALRQLGDFAGARRSLFIVADGAPGHPLSPLAFYHLGRAYACRIAG